MKSTRIVSLHGRCTPYPPHSGEPAATQHNVELGVLCRRCRRQFSWNQEASPNSMTPQVRPEGVLGSKRASSGSGVPPGNAGPPRTSFGIGTSSPPPFLTRALLVGGNINQLVGAWQMFGRAWVNMAKNFDY